MSLITPEIKNFLEKNKLGFVATVNSNGIPNVSPKGTIISWNADTLAFVDIRSPDTINNLKNNPNIEINVIDPLLRKGYLFSGTCSILHDGELFNEISIHYRNIGVTSMIKSIILVSLSKVSSVISPLYDTGVSEIDMKSKWKNHFENM